MNGLHFGVRFWTPKRGSFCRQNCGHRAKKSTSFDCFFMYATEVSHTAGFPGLCTEGLPSSRACADIHACRAWRTIARGAAKSWKPSGMQNLSCTRGDNRNLHYFLPGGKNFADKTTPVSGSVFGPQNGGQVARTQANQIETE